MRKILLYCIPLLLLTISFNSWGYTPDECITCHTEASKSSRLNIRIEEFNKSAHAKELICLDCHEGITDESHIKTKGSGKVNCGKCHEQKDLHGGGSAKEDVKCHFCHTRHRILDASDSGSSVYETNLRKTCSRCHPKQCGQKSWLSYIASFRIASHPKQNFSKLYDEGMCVGCHQGKAAHGEETPINSKQICYECHGPLGKRGALLGYIHTDADWDKQPVSFIAGIACLVAILIVVIGPATICGRTRLRNRDIGR